jgi:hypothetical protein
MIDAIIIPRKQDFEGEFLLQLAEASNTLSMPSRMLVCGSTDGDGKSGGFIAGRDVANFRPKSKQFCQASFNKTCSDLKTKDISDSNQPKEIKSGQSWCQDDCINILSWPKCFEDTSLPQVARRKQLNFHLGLINCSEIVEQRSCGTRAEREEKWSADAAAIASMLLSR